MSARVLIVDDAAANVRLLEAKLSQEFYETFSTFSGQEAIEAARKYQPDIILLDVMMPGMDGFETCQRLKQDPVTEMIPVVMVTALSDQQSKLRGLQAGADDFLSKPVNDLTLFSRIRSLVRLKMLIDEWRLRERTSDRLGVLSDHFSMYDLEHGNAPVAVVTGSAIEAENIRDILHSDENHITHYSSLETAKDGLSEQDYSLVIVDLMLGQREGLQFCARLRSSEAYRHLPILLVASQSEMDLLAKGLELGVSDYILRPLDRNELLARVRTQVRRKRYQDRLRSNYERSLEMALTDSLTGLYNRRYLTAHLSGMISKMFESQKRLSLLMFDIDFFKSVNDCFGHSNGDSVLKQMSERILQNVRGIDTVARTGGEEFVIVMPESDIEVVTMIAERLRENVENSNFDISGRKDGITVTISIGCSMLEESDTVDALLERADQALYQAKRTGRNRTVGCLDGEYSLLGYGKIAAASQEP